MTNEEVISAYSELVKTLAEAKVSNPSDAEDVYQEVFIRYIDKQPNFRDEDHAQAWFIKVTLNVVRSMYRRFEFAKRSDREDDSINWEHSARTLTGEKLLDLQRVNQLLKTKAAAWPPPWYFVWWRFFWEASAAGPSGNGGTVRDKAAWTSMSQQWKDWRRPWKKRHLPMTMSARRRKRRNKTCRRRRNSLACRRNSDGFVQDRRI